MEDFLCMGEAHHKPVPETGNNKWPDYGLTGGGKCGVPLLSTPHAHMWPSES